MKKNLPILVICLLIYFSSLGQKTKSLSKSDIKKNLTEKQLTSGTDSSFDILKKRTQAMNAYKKNTNNLNALWTFSETSEYLADYNLAIDGYKILVNRYSNGIDQKKLSKAKAHLITCKFLKQSVQPSPDSSNSNQDNSGIKIKELQPQINEPILTNQVNLNQQKKQNFLEKIITTLQNDTLLMKSIETAKKLITH